MVPDAFPIVVIIHDAWHTPTHYGRLIDMLTAQGFPTVCPQLLTSHTEEKYNSSFNDDCSMIYQLVFDLASDCHEIIVVAHGYGSFVASECLCDLSQQVRANMDKEGGVVELISLAGFLPEHGQTLKDCYGGDWPEFVKQQKDGSLRLYEPDAVLYNDIGAMERDHWTSHLVRFTARADDIVLTTGSPAWKYIHTTYAICDEDLLYTEDIQRQMLEATCTKGGPLPEEEYLEGTGHCAMISGPEKILAIIMAVAERGQAETYDGANEKHHESCPCGHGSECAGSCYSSPISKANPDIDGANEINSACRCGATPDWGAAFQSDRASNLSDIRCGDLPDEIHHSSKQSCVCDGKCVCHHNDNCPLKTKYSTMNPDCPCSYGEYYRRVSTATTGVNASNTDPLSSNYSGDLIEEVNFRDELAKYGERDPYASWDSGLATIGSVETTMQTEPKTEFERRLETFDDQQAEEIARDDASIRPGMQRSQSITPETGTSEDGSTAAKSEPGQQSRYDLFVPKMTRKTTTLPLNL